MSKLTAIISAFPGCGKSTAFNKLKKKINYGTNGLEDMNLT